MNQLRVLCSAYNYPCECGMSKGWRLQVSVLPASAPRRRAKVIEKGWEQPFGGPGQWGIGRGGGGVTTVDIDPAWGSGLLHRIVGQHVSRNLEEAELLLASPRNGTVWWGLSLFISSTTVLRNSSTFRGYQNWPDQ
jgi:hypothetical protein